MMNTANSDIYDITFIGGGPITLFGAWYAGFRHMRTKIIEALPVLGGQLMALYPEKFIYDAPGYPKIQARKLVENLIQQAELFNPSICLEESVQELQPGGSVIVLKTNKGEHRTRTVVICAGIGSLAPTRPPDVDLAPYEGSSVHYYLGDIENFRDQSVLVLGGGDLAVDNALALSKVARKVILVHKLPKLQAQEGGIETLQAAPVEVKLSSRLAAVEGQDGRLASALLRDPKSGDEESITLDAMIISLGFKGSVKSMRDWGLDMEKINLKTNLRMETNLPGVYAAGDMAVQEDGGEPLKLLSVGFGQAAIAVNWAMHYIDPAARIFPGHSSYHDLG
jgi:thioredoxin reductase (NADPH)